MGAVRFEGGIGNICFPFCDQDDSPASSYDGAFLMKFFRAFPPGIVSLLYAKILTGYVKCANTLGEKKYAFLRCTGCSLKIVLFPKIE